jgi:hypothetical protein
LLKNVAGRLDGIRWVGGGGLALAEFGTKGHYYRPEHDDPTPSLAIVDGRRGRVLQNCPRFRFRKRESCRAWWVTLTRGLDSKGQDLCVLLC